MVDIEEATTKQLFDELAKRNAATVVLICTMDGNARVMWQGFPSTCLGMTDMARCQIIDELKFTNAEE